MATIDVNPRKNIPHYDIFKYWKDKAILHNGDVVHLEYPLGADVEQVVFDWGEPCCWACGKPIISPYEENRPVGESVDLVKIWNNAYVKSKLNRCHIVPRTKGGEDAPRNLFLMCESCHESSPDTVNKNAFFRWVYDRRKTHSNGVKRPDIVYKEIEKRLKRRGLNISPVEIVSAIGDENTSYENLKEYLKSHIETHEFHFAESSILEGYVDWLVHLYIESCLKTG